MQNSNRTMPEPAQAKTTTGKKRYEAPKLELYGDVRDLTLGGSLTGLESQGKSRRNT